MLTPQPAELTRGLEEETQGEDHEAFQQALILFAGVALVVATFTIHNTFSILVAQRTRGSALLRAFGASRGQVLRSVTGEALLPTGLGALATLIGVVVLGPVVACPAAAVLGAPNGSGAVGDDRRRACTRHIWLVLEDAKRETAQPADVEAVQADGAAALAALGADLGQIADS